MKIKAAVDILLGGKRLEQGKTYDVEERDAQYLMRQGLARLDNPKDEKKIETPSVPVTEADKAGKAGK